MSAATAPAGTIQAKLSRQTLTQQSASHNSCALRDLSLAPYLDAVLLLPEEQREERICANGVEQQKVWRYCGHTQGQCRCWHSHHEDGLLMHMIPASTANIDQQWGSH